MKRRTRTSPAPDLPVQIRELFWDCDARSVSWENDRDFIISRILTSGEWEAVRWLRRAIDDEAVAAWITARHGRGMSPERLRYWELVLGLNHRTVTSWLRDPARVVWDRRASA